MNTIEPMRGPGQFQWNGGGWIGSVVGGTAWMLVASAFMITKGAVLPALVPVGCAAVTILVGYALWHFRDRVPPFPAMMTLLAVMAFALPIAWFSTERWCPPQILSAMHFPRSQWWVVGLVPLLMLWFGVQERRSRKVRATEVGR